MGLLAIGFAAVSMLHSCLCWLNHRYYMPLLKYLAQIRSVFILIFMRQYKFLSAIFAREKMTRLM